MPESAPADLVIRARWILPVEPAGQVLEGYAVVVRAGRIVSVEPAGGVPVGPATQVVDRPEHVLLPGLVNAHGHAAMTLLRSAAGGLAVDDWLRRRIWPLEQRLVDEQFVADGTELAVAEMLLSGITCHADMYYHPEVAARVTAQAGMRGVIGLPVLETATAWARDVDEYLDRSLALHDEYRDDPLVGTAFALHSPLLTGDATLARVRTLADQLQAPVMVHLLESPGERGRELRRHGTGPLERLENAGLVNDLLVAVHCVQASSDEIGRLARGGASVVHCPASNLRLGCGIAPVGAMRAAGLNLALGTDGAASNGSLDLFAEARLACLLAAGVSGEATSLEPAAAVEMATLAGARALGIADATGSLLPGKWADLACVRLAGPRTEPVYDVPTALLHAARHDVTDTWVAGRQLVEERRLTRLDLADLSRRVADWPRRVLAAADQIAGQ